MINDKRVRGRVWKIVLWCSALGLTCVVMSVGSCKILNYGETRRLRIGPRLDEGDIRSGVLERTPLGSTPDSVLTFARRFMRQGKEPYYDERSPAIRHFKGPRTVPQAVGKSHITILLGRDGWNPLMARDVWIMWAFDNDRKLIDVIVEKSADGL
jgi:hypothetical protein